MIDPCEHFRTGITNKTADECPYCEIDRWKTKYSNAMDVNADLRGKLVERQAEYLAAHITYDKGYQSGREDAEDAEKDTRLWVRALEMEFTDDGTPHVKSYHLGWLAGIEASQQRLMQMHRTASERHNLYGHAALELEKLKESK